MTWALEPPYPKLLTDALFFAESGHFVTDRGI
jgi:hypothetical protein